MSEAYFPFDFGAWRSTDPMTCPRHGPQYGGPMVRVTPQEGGPVTTRRYCGLCVIDALDAAVDAVDLS